MDCLKGYIGISSYPAAESGLYLTALPDISIAIISKVVDPSDTETIEQIMGEIEKRAILKFRTLFTIEFNRCFKVNRRETIECVICENKALLAVALWYLFGAEFCFERINSSRLNRYTTIDKAKAYKLRDEFEEIFRNELSVAVVGIDIDGSSCFDAPANHSGFISVIETQP